jgi:Response regulator containing CheY-like receiver domain and AraC-type DNA-binding domain
MLKVLVVDDEVAQVTTFVSIIKNMKPDYEVFKAMDGKEALDFFLANPVDIIITDIRMPDMSGLEMIEKVIASGHKPEIVILSGYGEFQYAQKAINFGVFEYLLKPVAKSDIVGILDRLEKKFLEKRSEQNQKNILMKKLDYTFPVYIEHQLNSWISRDLNENEIEEIYDIFPEKGYVNVLAVKIKRFTKITGIYNSEEIKRLLQHFKFMMKEALVSIGHSISFFSEKSQNIMVTLLTSGSDFNLRSEKNKTVIKSFCTSVKDELGATVAIGVGNRSTDIANGVSQSYEQAAKAVEYNFFSSHQDIIYFSEINAEEYKNRNDIYSFEKELAATTQRNSDNIPVKTFYDIFDKYSNRLSGIKPQRLKECLYYTAIQILKTIKWLLAEEHYDILVESVRNSIFESESYSELKCVFIDILDNLAGYMNNKRNKENYIIVDKYKKYIQEKYMEDLSLESASSKFHFTPSYFSSIFKNYIGIGFSEYLMAVRIERAQHLLKNTDFKVYEISEKVGYKDATYFNKIFKREVGISPYKFRQVSSDL